MSGASPPGLISARNRLALGRGVVAYFGPGRGCPPPTSIVEEEKRERETELPRQRGRQWDRGSPRAGSRTIRSQILTSYCSRERASEGRAL